MDFQRLGLRHRSTTARGGGTAWRSCRRSVSTTRSSGLRRRRGPRPRRPDRLGHAAAACGSARCTCRTGGRWRTTTTSTSSHGWTACGRHLDRNHAPLDEQLVVLGDWNVAPADDDVWDPAAFEGCTHVSAARARGDRGACSDWGLVDTLRERYPRAGHLQLLGLSQRRLPQAAGHAHRLPAGSTRAGAARRRRPDRPQRPQGHRSRRTTRRCWPTSTWTERTRMCGVNEQGRDRAAGRPGQPRHRDPTRRVDRHGRAPRSRSIEGAGRA